MKEYGMIWFYSKQEAFDNNLSDEIILQLRNRYTTIANMEQLIELYRTYGPSLTFFCKISMRKQPIS